MNPHVVLDCQKVVPNRFALALAAAARSRALRRGAEPRLDIDVGTNDLALHEIAAGVFTQNELAPFLPETGGRAIPFVPRSGSEVSRRRLPMHGRRTRLPSAGGGSLMVQSNRQGETNDAEVSVFR